MALSKHENVTEKLNKIEFKTYEQTIHKEEIMLQCYYTHHTAISVDLIHHLMGSPDMDFRMIPVEESFECYHYCRQEMLDSLKQTKMQILFFEDRNNSNSNVWIVALKQEKSKGLREHIVLLALIRITVMEVSPKIGFCCYFNVRVRKSAKAKNIETQLEIITKDIFNIVYGSEKHMKKQLLDDAFVFSLQYPGHKWRFLTGDRQPPKNYVPNMPPKEQGKKKLFPEDDSLISESDDNNTSPETKQKKIFKFRKLDVKKEKSPSSSPLPWPPTPIVISSDEELERSMCELEEKISLEMDSD